MGSSLHGTGPDASTVRPTLLLHMRGHPFPPLKLTHSGGNLWSCYITDSDGFRTIPTDNKPALSGPSGAMVEVLPLRPFILSPNDTLNLSLTLADATWRRLGFYPEMFSAAP
jgi:hypothetical protein